jgi:hypothetical protein
MTFRRGIAAVVVVSALLLPASAVAQTQFPWEQVVQREVALIAWLKNQKPVVETYIQGLKPGLSRPQPTADLYFLGRLGFGEHWHADATGDFDEQVAFGRESRSRSLRAYSGGKWTYFPVGFAAMVLPDAHALKPNNYSFQYEGTEYLGKTECLRFQVTPRVAQEGRFFGQIWVESGGYNTVRFSGTFSPPNSRQLVYLHFDSWRVELQPNLWVPAYVYVEESDHLHASPELRLKAITSLWGYAVSSGAPAAKTQTPADPAPMLRVRATQALSPGNQPRSRNRVVEVLERDGLLAAEGAVESRLNEIVEQIRSENRLSGEPISCRVLLTTPLEAFSAGNTIVVSRGLLDVAPNDEVLAVVLAHQLAHILLGDSDLGIPRGTPSIFDERFHAALPWLKADPAKEELATAKTLSLLRHSRYGQSLGEAGGFFEELKKAADILPNLSQARFGANVSAQFPASFLQALSNSVDPAGREQRSPCALGSRAYIQLADASVSLGEAACAPEHQPLEVLFGWPRLSMNSTALEATIDTKE